MSPPTTDRPPTDPSARGPESTDRPGHSSAGAGRRRSLSDRLVAGLRPLPGRAVRGGQWALGYRGVPFMARSTFRHELIANCLAGLALGVVKPEFTQLFARKSLGGSGLLLAIIMAEATAGNFLGALLAPHLQRRRRVPTLVRARLGLAGCMLLIALLPVHPASAYLLVAILMFCALLGAVNLNSQSGIWHSNYPGPVRGLIFSRLFGYTVLSLAAGAQLASQALDLWPWAHRLVYPVAAGAMVCSAAVYSRIRQRHERSILATGRRDRPDPLGGLKILRDDRRFRWFMTWQLISGSMVLMCNTPIALILVDRFGVDYSRGTAARMLIPLGVMAMLVPAAGHLFDRLGPNRFRTINVLLWVVSRTILTFGAMLLSWPLVLTAFAVRGAASSAGAVAFHIGHTKFAPPGKGQAYMGVHMTLQGVRGLTMPFLGVWLYHALGWGVLALAAGVQFIAAIGFYCSAEPEPVDDNPSAETL